MECIHCGSDKLRKNGSFTLNNGVTKIRYRCGDCGKSFSDIAQVSVTTPSNKFTPDIVLTSKRYVITSCQNNTPTNNNFLESLENYCEWNDVELIVIPTYHQEVLYPWPLIEWDCDEKYLIRDKFSINNMITVLANIKINASAENPLGGLDSLTKGKSLIVPHNQLQLRSLPVMVNDHPVIMTTTGTISEPNYVKSKAGEKAEFNHSNSAIFVNIEDDMFHMRVLNADHSGGFYDIDGYYSPTKYTPLSSVEALITGDEHVIVNSELVSAATYTNEDSIVNTLKPKKIIRHDVLDCFTISHHHKKDNFIQYSKYINDMNRIEDELEQTIQYIENTTPDWSETYIVSSNHHDHLKRWLTEADPKLEPWNAKIYHMLTYMMLQDIENARDNGKGLYVPDPFKLYVEEGNYRFKFISRDDSFKIHNIELSNHGDKGANGSRGSLAQFSKFADKAVIGHSHTPGINKGAYSVGTSTSKSLEYVSGPSSWMNTHCIIYPNGKRQLINIINGKWK